MRRCGRESSIPATDVWTDSDSDPASRTEPQVRSKQRRKRPRTEAQGTTLRDLLGLTAADDYIESRVDKRTDSRSSSPPYLVPPTSKAEIEEAVNHSSSEEELVLSTSLSKAKAQGDSAQVSKSSAPIHHTDSHGLTDEHLVAAEDSGPASRLLIGRTSSSFNRAKRLLKSDASENSSTDEEEMLLGTRPALRRVTSPAQSDRDPRNKSASVVDGQRPAFLVPAESAHVGSLELAPGIKVPASINRFLRAYQQEGVKFLMRSYIENRGALLGDDMGLGKTIQVIAFLAAIMHKTGTESDADRRIEAERSDRQVSRYHKANLIWPTCLIICPSSVIDNWRHELDTWGYFEHAAFTGAKARETIDNLRRGRLDIVVTSHETASAFIDQLSDLDWSCIFIDEAHKLKNAKSQMTQSMHRFKCMARFALTGTSIQNTYRELYTLADWTNPGLLGTVKEWTQEIEEPLKQGQRKDASEEELANSRTRAEKLVQNVLPLFFLRRTKALIQEQLPRKFDKVVFCPMTVTQLAVYKRILSEPEVDLMRRHADPCECGRLDPDTGLPYRRQNCCHKTNPLGEPWNKDMLKFVYLLQKCSNHVALVFPEPEDAMSKEPDRVERYNRQLAYVQLMFPGEWADKRCNAANGMDERLCGKWKVLSELLAQWHSDGDKVLLFSTNMRLLQFIEFFISKQGHAYLRLDGSTPQHKRQQLVNDFNKDPSIFLFLISTTAGGTGLNLTAANRVVVFDPHWNPSHDLQAMDRAYRFGQTRDVYVYRLIGAGSLEECIYGRQLYKQQQMEIGYTAAKERRYFEGVAGDKQNLGELFGCRNLFTLHETSTSMKAIIEQCDLSDVTFALQRRMAANPTDSADKAVVALASQANSQDLPAASCAKAKKSAAADPIKGLLDGAGVKYVHEHQALTGGSSAETIRSRKAQTNARRSRKPAVSKAAKPTREEVPTWPPVRSKVATSAPPLQES